MTAVDLLVRGARIVDGTGGPWVRGEIAVAGGRITAMGTALRVDPRDVLDAGDLVVAPGFIDLHAHADLGLLVDGQWDSAVAQGVTTIVIGQDGLGIAPLNETALTVRRRLRAINGDPDAVDWTWRTFDDYLRRLEAAPLGPNVAVMASHGTIRLVVLGEAARPPDRPELERMEALASERCAPARSGSRRG